MFTSLKPLGNTTVKLLPIPADCIERTAVVSHDGAYADTLQPIDTLNDRWIIEFKRFAINQFTAPFGSENKSGTNVFPSAQFRDFSSMDFYVGSGALKHKLNDFIGEKLIWDSLTTDSLNYKTVITVNDEKYEYNGVFNGSTSNLNVFLFALNRNGSAVHKSAEIAIYSAIRYNLDGKYRAYLTPITDNTGVPCFFDRVNGTYHYNKGSEPSYFSYID